jgi:hypothetical protein
MRHKKTHDLAVAVAFGRHGRGGLGRVGGSHERHHERPADRLGQRRGHPSPER